MVGIRDEFNKVIDDYLKKYPYLISEEALWEAYKHVAIEATLNIGMNTLVENEILMRFKDRHLIEIKKIIQTN